MQLKKIPQIARYLGISNETARRLAKTRWTLYRVGPGSVLVDLDEILAHAKEKPEPNTAKQQKISSVNNRRGSRSDHSPAAAKTKGPKQ